MVRPPFWLPLPMVLLALTMMPSVVVGVRYPFTICHVLKELTTEATVPVVGKHTPLCAKHPAVMLKPLAAVVEPVLEMEKRVVVAPELEVEAMAKSVVLREVDAA